MQTTIKEIIKLELLRTCSEITRKLREKDEKKEKKRKFTREQQADVECKFKACGWDAAKIQLNMEAMAILFNAPELKAGAIIPRELFAVVVLDANPDGRHVYAVGVPHIVTHENNCYLMHTDGALTNWAYQIKDKPRLATDKEVEKCINNLTDKQWNTIKTHDTFKPIMDAVMNKTIEVEDHSGNGDGGVADGDIELPDGRTISV